MTSYPAWQKSVIMGNKGPLCTEYYLGSKDDHFGSIAYHNGTYIAKAYVNRTKTEWRGIRGLSLDMSKAWVEARAFAPEAL